VTAAEVMSKKVHACVADDDLHTALATMRNAHVRRLPVLSKEDALVGVISMDDILLRAEASGAAKAGIVSAEEIVDAFRAINTHQLSLVVAKHAAGHNADVH
jgi:CBS domain-containing protein